MNFLRGKILNLLKLYHQFQPRLQNKGLNLPNSCKLKTFSEKVTAIQLEQGVGQLWEVPSDLNRSVNPRLLEWVHQHWTRFLASIWSLGTRLSCVPQHCMWMLLIRVSVNAVSAKGSNCLPFIIYHHWSRTAEWFVKWSKTIGDLKTQH